jgi:hypothetical protein
MMSRIDKARIARYIILLVIAILIVYPLLNVGFHFNLFDSGGCIAIVYDKAAMRAADKVVLCVGEDRYDITDAALVSWITEEAMAATHTHLRFHEHTDRWIEIYRGETLVRRMRWAECADPTGVFVYQEDEKHPIIHGY